MIICFERIIVTKTVLAKFCRLSESMYSGYFAQDSGVACMLPGCAVEQRV